MKLLFARDIVCGMKYLHSLEPPVIHSDLKSKNVLVSNALVAKVSYDRVAFAVCVNSFILLSKFVF